VQRHSKLCWLLLADCQEAQHSSPFQGWTDTPPPAGGDGAQRRAPRPACGAHGARACATAVSTGSDTRKRRASVTTTPAVATPSATWLLLARMSASASPRPSRTPTDLRAARGQLKQVLGAGLANNVQQNYLPYTYPRSTRGTPARSRVRPHPGPARARIVTCAAWWASWGRPSGMHHSADMARLMQRRLPQPDQRDGAAPFPEASRATAGRAAGAGGRAGCATASRSRSA